jgi:hypothetical protein
MGPETCFGWRGVSGGIYEDLKLECDTNGSYGRVYAIATMLCGYISMVRLAMVNVW